MPTTKAKAVPAADKLEAARADHARLLDDPDTDPAEFATVDAALRLAELRAVAEEHRRVEEAEHERQQRIDEFAHRFTSGTIRAQADELAQRHAEACSALKTMNDAARALGESLTAARSEMAGLGTLPDGWRDLEARSTFSIRVDGTTWLVESPDRIAARVFVDAARRSFPAVAYYAYDDIRRQLSRLNIFFGDDILAVLGQHT